MPSVLISGAGRGLGLEFARQYAADGWRVIAGMRQPDTARELDDIAARHEGRVAQHRLDVTDPATIEALARALDGAAIDLLLNNAGIYGSKSQSLGTTDYESWNDVMRVNVMGPMRLVEAFAENVARSKRRLIVTLSSQMGSIAEAPGGYYLYRSSKAAVNAVTANLASDLKARGVVVVAIHPGWVRTDMGGRHARLSPEESVEALRAIIERLTPNDSGRFINYTGDEIPW